MARMTITTVPQKVCAGRAAGGDNDTLSFVVLSPTSTGVVLIKKGTVGVAAPGMADAARWDFSKAMLTYACEPTVALWASTASGTVDVDIAEGGQR